MILQFLAILISIVVLYLVFTNKTHKFKNKMIALGIFLLILTICSKSIYFQSNIESFNVSMPSDKDIENFENSRPHKKNKELKLSSPKYNKKNSYLDEDEEKFVSNSGDNTSNDKKNNVSNISDLDNFAIKKNKLGIENKEEFFNKHKNGEAFSDVSQKNVSDSNLFQPSVNISVDGGDPTDETTNVNPDKYSISISPDGIVKKQYADGFEDTKNDNSEKFNLDGNHSKSNKLSTNIYSENEEEDPFKFIENMNNTYVNKQKKYRNKEPKQFSSEKFQETPTNQYSHKTISDGTFQPGMAYLPPKVWFKYFNKQFNDMKKTVYGQHCPPSSDINTRRLPIGIMDPGTPINAFEVANDGLAPKTEKDCHLTNVGSIMPKFSYTEYKEDVTYEGDENLDNNYYYSHSDNCKPYGLGAQDRKDRCPPKNPYSV